MSQKEFDPGHRNDAFTKSELNESAGDIQLTPEDLEAVPGGIADPPDTKESCFPSYCGTCACG